MRKLFYTILSAALILCASCQREKPVQGDDQGSLSIAVRSGEMISRTKGDPAIETAADGTAAAGDLINNLRVYIVDGDEVVAFASSLASSEDRSVAIAPDRRSATVRLVGLDVGVYKMYLLANAPVAGSWDLAEGSTLTNAFKNSSISLPAGAKAASFSEAEGMPLSLIQDELIIKAGDNRISAELLRICARLRVYFSNMTSPSATPPLNLCVTSMSFTAKNMASGYVFDDGSTVPAFTPKREFIQYDNSTEPISTIPSSEGFDPVCLFDSYIFDTGALGEFEISVSGAVTTDAEPTMGDGGGTVTRLHGAATTPGSTDTADSYLIKNVSADFFLTGAVGASLVTGEVHSLESEINSELNNAGYEKYLWRVENKTANSFQLRNVNSGKYLSIPSSNNSQATFSNSATTLSYNANNLIYTGAKRNWYKLFYSSASARSNYSNKNSVDNGNSDAHKWLFYPVLTNSSGGSGGLSGIQGDPFIDSFPVTYIDDHSVAQILERIKRNQEMSILINVYFSPAINAFQFELLHWIPVENETTFD